MKKYEILLVDDDRLVRQTIGKTLEDQGYRVTLAGDGQEALEILDRQNFDLVLTDLVMEPVDGIGLLKKVKKINPESMVLILTGFGDLNSAIDAIRLNADDYLLKPCDPEDLSFRISSCLDKMELKRQAKRSAKALAEAHRKLELKVKERTAELAQTNLKLKQEIEERKGVAEALKESEQQYKSIFENIIDVYYRADLGGNLTLASPSAATLLGYDSINEILGKNIAEDFYLEPKERKYLIREILKHGTIKFEGRLKRKDGSVLIVETNSRLVCDQAGKPIGVEGIFRDVTERVEAEKQLQESEERYRMLVETMNDGLVVQNDTGAITYVNQRFCQMIGYAQEEVIDRPVKDFIVAAQKRLLRKKTLISVRGDQKSYQMAWVSKKGQRISTLVSPASIYDNKGRLRGSFAVIADITALKETEKALKKREKQLKIKTESLQEVNDALKVLIAKREEDRAEMEDNVLSNIKQMIIPYLEKLKQTDIDDRQQVYCNIVESNLNEIISPFPKKLSLKYLNLTPTELQIATMVQHGHITRKIAEIMDVSPRTIDTHRRNIRRKMGLENKKGNLRSHLLAYN